MNVPSAQVPIQKATLLAGLHQNPGDAGFLEALGTLLDREAAWEELIEHFLVQRSAVPSGSMLDGYVHYMLGKAATELGRTEEALSWLQQAIAIRADFPFAHHLLARALRHLGRLPDALSASQVCTSLAPGFPWGWLEAGEIQLLLGLPLEAVETLQRGRNLLPQDATNELEVFERALESARQLIKHQDQQELAQQLWPDRPPLANNQELDPLDGFELDILRFRRLLDRLEQQKERK
jgi:tetratricopeptide (TPR) repeat protein